MINFIISLLLGIIPDVMYYYVYLRKIKNICDKKNIFFLLLIVNYVICIILIQYHFYLYIIQDIIMYLIMKKMYNSQINDIFLVFFLELYMILLSIMCFFLIENYTIAFIVYRMLMFAPLLFINKIKLFYKNYTMLWNRHNIPNKIKSITLRNISLVVLNVLIILMYIILIYISNIY